jgi:hypothetical protein
MRGACVADTGMNYFGLCYASLTFEGYSKFYQGLTWAGNSSTKHEKAVSSTGMQFSSKQHERKKKTERKRGKNYFFTIWHWKHNKAWKMVWNSYL